MAFTDIYKLNEEITVFARNQDILTTAERGVTTATDTITATTSDTFTLTNTIGVRNIRYVTVAGTTKSAYQEFTPDYPNGTFTASSANPSDEVVVQYDYGNRDSVYGPLPQEIVDRLSYPRLMAKVVTDDTQEFALGGGANITDWMITFQMWSTSIKRLYNGVTSIRSSVLSNKHNFHHFPFITVVGRGRELDIDHEEQGNVETKGVDCVARFKVERV